MCPTPTSLIRTGGEQRISNFLLWQAAYSELYFSDKLWPEFDAAALDEALADYAARERRFGKTSEQVTRAAAHARPPEAATAMLKQRIITAIVLLAILLPALFWPSPLPFAAVMLVLIAAGGLGVGPPERTGAGRLGCCGGRLPGAVRGVLVRRACWSGRCRCSGSVAGALWVLAGALRCCARGVAGWPQHAARPCAWSAACWRCGWPGWRWRRRA